MERKIRYYMEYVKLNGQLTDNVVFVNDEAEFKQLIKTMRADGFVIVKTEKNGGRAR